LKFAAKNFVSSSSQFYGIDPRILLTFFLVGFASLKAAAFSASFSSFFYLQGALGTPGFFSLIYSSSSTFLEETALFDTFDFTGAAYFPSSTSSSSP
jgi:hypothetical protein